MYINGEVVEKGQFDGIPDNAFNHYTSWVEAISDGYGSEKHKNLNSGSHEIKWNGYTIKGNTLSS